MKTVDVVAYTQSRHSLSISDENKMSQFNTHRNIHQIGVANIRCVNNQYAKFEYKGMKSVGVTDSTKQTSSMHYGRQNYKIDIPPPIKMKKYS